MKILIADRLAKVRYALSVLLQKNSGWMVCDLVGDTGDLLIKVRLHNPDVLLLDWSLLGKHPEEEFKTIQHTCPDLHIIVMGVDPEIKRFSRSIGIHCFLSKAEPADKLIASLHSYEGSLLRDTAPLPRESAENLVE